MAYRQDFCRRISRANLPHKSVLCQEPTSRTNFSIGRETMLNSNNSLLLAKNSHVTRSIQWERFISAYYSNAKVVLALAPGLIIHFKKVDKNRRMDVNPSVVDRWLFVKCQSHLGTVAVLWLANYPSSLKILRSNPYDCQGFLNRKDKDGWTRKREA